MTKAIFLILFSFSIVCSYCINYSSQTKNKSLLPQDSCEDIVKRFDPFKEDSVLQTKAEKMGKLFFVFLLNSKDVITLQIKFYTYSAHIIPAGEFLYINLVDSSVIKLKLTDDSYPGIAGKNHFVHILTFDLNDKAILQKLKRFPILSAKCSNYNFNDLTNQKKFIENLDCISTFLK